MFVLHIFSLMHVVSDIVEYCIWNLGSYIFVIVKSFKTRVRILAAAMEVVLSYLIKLVYLIISIYLFVYEHGTSAEGLNSVSVCNYGS